MQRVSIEESDLERAILSTIAYYDVFEYPLTALELWQYAIAPDIREFTLGDVQRLLDESALLREKLETESGMYFLRGRSLICTTRRDRSTIAIQKMKRAKRVALLLASVPFVRFVAVCNSLGMRHASAESDIDFVLGVRAGTLWIARALSLLLLRTLRLRPGQRGNVRDTICVCFFLSIDRASIERITLPASRGVGDVYTAGWIQHLVPLYDESGFAERFISENAWALALRPNLRSVMVPPHRAVRVPTAVHCVRSCIERALAPFTAYLEKATGRMQRTALPHALKSLLNADTRVWADDSLLKFHPNDRREHFRTEWLKRCNTISQCSSTAR